MVMYLDSDSNKKGSPNETLPVNYSNFSRWVRVRIEENDIPEIARASWLWLNDNFHFEFNPEDHDEGEKTVFGETGTFSGSDIITMILSKDRAAVYICENLWTNLSVRPRRSHHHDLGRRTTLE